MATPKYAPLETDESPNGTSSTRPWTSLQRPEKSAAWGERLRSINPTILLVCTNIITLLLALFLFVRCQGPQGSCCPEKSFYETGFETDFEAAKPALKTQLVDFSGELFWNETSEKIYRQADLNEQQYVGAPSVELDKSWDELLGDWTFGVLKDEITGMRNITTMPRTGQYYIQLETFHNLHCLRLSPWIYKPQNYIRRYIDKDFYSTIPSHHQKQGPELERIHLEHCVDQIRQSLQCGGDITPVTMALYGVGEKSVIIGTSQRHTCRDFEALREWQRRKNREVGIEPLDLA